MNDDFDYDGDSDEETDGKGLLPKTLQKALLSGVSAVLMTEEGIRNALGDMRMPKEAIGYLVQQTERSRKDLFQAVSSEVKGFLGDVDLPGAVRKALIGMKVEVRANIRFIDEATSETSIETTTIDDEADDVPPKRTRKTKSKTKRKTKKKTASDAKEEL